MHNPYFTQLYDIKALKTPTCFDGLTIVGHSSKFSLFTLHGFGYTAAAAGCGAISYIIHYTLSVLLTSIILINKTN